MLTPHPTAPCMEPLGRCLSSCIDPSHLSSPTPQLWGTLLSAARVEGRLGPGNCSVGVTSSCPIPWLRRALSPTCEAGEGKFLSCKALPARKGCSGRSEGELWRCSASISSVGAVMGGRSSVLHPCQAPHLLSPPRRCQDSSSPPQLFLFYFFSECQ